MATTTYGNATAITTLRESFAARIATARANHARWRTYRRTHDELSALSDRDLADLGMSRSGIRAVAYEAAYGA
ncbi:hypothetical protein JSE7799_00491 [Jannaschia seosinensis]|uniref:YjiS-like domain-containing protein n=1 Tax=Jannaschia seosinensis TaxID=313367 RepID=A0A0M7B728_9RHOB|nr:DUF1127 domain-containing protein [Jannaschia seosinensis]CUH19704.1 hypothetical protein JSE7799_00491 [Jannaschia seosinensis]